MLTLEETGGMGSNSTYSNDTTTVYGTGGSGGGGGGAPTKPWLIELLSQIYLVALPLICVTGVVGNALAFFIFASKPMRRTSCSWYLATRSVSDGGFLLATFITWSSDASRMRFFHTNGLCQITIFSTFVFAFLSVWMTVVVTCENFIRICRPFSVSTFCNVRIAKMCIAGLVALSIIMYNYPMWTSAVMYLDRGNKTYHWCGTQPVYASLVKWLSFWDMLITLIVPSLIIVILMIFITASLVKSIKRQNRLQGGAGGAGGHRSNGEAGHNEANNHYRSRSNSPQAKVTWMLFTVSLLFILLNSPSHIIRSKMAIVALLYGPQQRQSPTAEEKIQVVFQIIYYLSFGVNLLVYLTCGDNFRKIFKETYLKTCLRTQRRSASNEMTALTTVRLDETENNRIEPPHTVRFQQQSEQKVPVIPVQGSNPDLDNSGTKNNDSLDSNVPELNGNSHSSNINDDDEKKNLISLQTTDL